MSRIHLLDTIYAGTVISYGLIPGIVGAAACYFLSLRYRWPVFVVMSLTTIYAVTNWAQDYGVYLVGCVDFVIACTAAICLRAERKRTPISEQHPYDLAAFVVVTVIMSPLYQAPPV